MLVLIAIIIGSVFLWELLEGLGIVAWGLFELMRQVLRRG